MSDYEIVSCAGYGRDVNRWRKNRKSDTTYCNECLGLDGADIDTHNPDIDEIAKLGEYE